MVFMARAAAPILPGCEGRERTTRIRDSGPPAFILESGVQQHRSFEFPDEKMHPMLGIAVRAARRAGAIINRAARDVDLLPVTRKRHNDFVTEVDKAAEQAVIEILHRAYPDHAILAEESGASAGSAGDSEYTWIIDPLDGTTNFIHGFPQYAVSIGLKHKGVLTQGVIYDPTKNELFTATRGRGAYLNERRIRVSKRLQLNEALIGTGFPFRDLQSLDEYLTMFREFTVRTAGLRRAGAAALDIAYVAAGRLDGFWEMGLSPWDMAAGALMVQEAGGLVGDFRGDSGYLDSGRIVCGSPKIFAQMLQVIGPLAARQ
jgi:myo-inositol-1(or 4)-monophosphatase